MCPPLLHEHVRSYRFFSQVASHIAGAGVAVLRFDYYGTGDSSGDVGDFDPDATGLDLALAVEELRRVVPGASLTVMGARASALFAWRDAAALGADALWLWQPIVDGGLYVHSLESRDRDERRSRSRYPLLKGVAPGLPNELMGFLVSPGFCDALAALTLSGPSPTVPVSLVDTVDGAGQSVEVGERVILPSTLDAWTRQVELHGLIPLRDAREALDSLLASRATGGTRG